MKVLTGEIIERRLKEHREWQNRLFTPSHGYPWWYQKKNPTRGYPKGISLPSGATFTRLRPGESGYDYYDFSGAKEEKWEH